MSQHKGVLSSYKKGSFDTVTECEQVYDIKNINVLKYCEFEPVLPDDMKAARSELLKKMDKILFTIEFDEIINEVENKTNKEH